MDKRKENRDRITNNIKGWKSNKAITLISLVITIIILLVLAGVSSAMLTGENRILKKTATAKEENNKKTATEIMNLKITNTQIESYKETEKMPTLQYLANKLCEDNEMEYVELSSKLEASLTPIDTTRI